MLSRKMTKLRMKLTNRSKTTFCSAKTKVTKLRHELERLWVKDSEVTDIESMIEQLWAALEDVQEILGELSAFYVEFGEDTGKKEAFKKSRKNPVVTSTTA